MVTEAENLLQKLVPTLYEDEQLLAVAKPAGVDAGAAGRRASGDLVEVLAKTRNRGENLAVTNRLNRHESGVLLLGKSPAIVEHIRTGLTSNRIEQEYVAVVLGHMVKSPLSIDPGQGSSRGKLRPGQTRKDPPRPRRDSRASAVKEGKGKRGTPRQTVVRAVRTGARRTLVRCKTTVENTHALRAQLRAVRLRVLGDHLHDVSHRPQASDATCLHLARISFHHPEKKRKVTVSSRVPSGFNGTVAGERDDERALGAALTRRLPLVAEGATDAYRLLTGNAENVKGLVAERYGPIIVLQVLDDRRPLLEALPQIARWYREILGLRAVYVKRFVKDRVGADTGQLAKLRSPEPLVGKRVPPQIEIIEHGLRFAVRPYDGFSVGLFLDHRENRSRIRTLAAGKNVLNLFAYTCGFSVAAAAGGAGSVVSVDLSPKYLAWGRTNFDLNGLDPADHQFITSDALDYLSRAKRQERRFELIVLDPPTFAHGRRSKHGFSVTRDLAVLVGGAVELLAPGGELLISTNNRRLSMRALRDRIEEGAGRRRYRITSTPRPPIDFAMDPDHSKTILARFD